MGSRPRRRAAWTPLGALLFLLFACGVSNADEPVYGPADTVRVGADRPAWIERIERLPFFASVKDLEETPERLRSIADILEEAAGVRIRRYGSLGSYATASIRASAPGQVEIYLDGVPLNSAEWGATNLAEIPIDNLVRAEIYRSGAPAEFGAPGIGGIVNLVTRPAGSGNTSIGLTGGSYETWKASLLQSGRGGGAAYLLSYRHLQTRGDFPFLYDPGTRFQNVSDDTLLTRENNAFREHALLGKIDLPPLAGWRLSIRDDWYLKESGLPGHGNLIYEEASFDNRRHVASAHLASPAFAGRVLRAEITAFHHYRRDRYFNPGREPMLHMSDLTHRSASTGGRALATAYWLVGRQTFRLGGGWRRERFTPTDGDPRIGTGFTRERRLFDLSAEDVLSLAAGRLELLAAYRYLESEDNFHGYLPYGPAPEARESPFRSEFGGPAFGVRAQPVQAIVVRASRTRYGRFPTLFEIFGTNGDAAPNPDLVPEEGTTWDGGIEIRFDRGALSGARFQVSAFRSVRDSLIYFIQNSQRNFKAVNLENAIAEGIEAEWSLGAGKRFRSEGSFTTQDARQHGGVPQWEGKWLPYVGPREFFARTSVRLGRFTFRHEYSFHDRQYRDRANSEIDRAPARHIHNIGAKARFGSGRFTFDLDIQNLGNDKNTDSFGYPMPGRSFYVTLACGSGHGSATRPLGGDNR